MEKADVIYEKKHDHLAEDDYERISTKENEIDVSSWRDSSEFLKRLAEDTVRIVIPERVENRGFFIAQAKEIANHNEIDTIITEYDDRLVAEFHFSDDSTNFGIKGIIEYADDVCFGCNKGEVILSVIYYTHATYCKGRRIAPIFNISTMM